MRPSIWHWPRLRRPETPHPRQTGAGDPVGNMSPVMTTAESHKERRLTARGAKTRARIVAAAADLMYVKGVGATTLDDVLAASGVSKSQLYHHFDGKDALVR